MRLQSVYNYSISSVTHHILHNRPDKHIHILKSHEGLDYWNKTH